ncbi:MAG TPA: aminotransferase class V-fold PLP-dependent enzyme [Woeseiaceae bacterium]|nr:aminotransferase class V-fold PLP-dependent enzyme [Woeseiaceae bacterium]
MKTHDLRNKVEGLREAAARLEPDAAHREQSLGKVAAHAEEFLRSLPHQPVYAAPGDRDEVMQAFQVREVPAGIEEALDLLGAYVDGKGQTLGSSRFFAYIPSGGLYESALADYLAAVTNPFAGVGQAAPGAVRMEESLLHWLAGVVGYPETAEGDLTSGGSMAALSAVVAAREAAAINSSRVVRSVVYLTTHTHHTFRKALHIAGLGDCVVREVAVDSRHRMDPVALQQQIQNDLDDDLSPWFIAATAGTTNAGAVDPLDEIADVAQEFKLWFHVDAAYGGSFALCETGKQRLAGLERTDSLILDPHKGFFLPCGIGVVLVRDGRKLYDAYHARGAYMQDMSHDTERSPCDFSAELTRPFRALRFWLPFKIHGSRPFAAALEEKLLLARYFYEQVSLIPEIEVGSPPDLSIVTFRYLPRDGGADTFNRRLADAIRDDGRVFLTSTTMSGHYTIRMAILNFRTHIEDVDMALAVIREKIAELAA